MKTFETEKHNIPDGATHYRDETNFDSFAWYCDGPTPKLIVDGEVRFGYQLAVSGENLNSLKPIPQTNIETPEEKEALDRIETNDALNSIRDSGGFSDVIDLSESGGVAGKEVVWANGEDVEAYGKLYKYVGLDPFNDNLCICLANEHDDPQCFSIEVLSKPETPQQRKEREAVENLRDAIQQCEDLGLRTYHAEKLVTGAMLNDGVINLS